MSMTIRQQTFFLLALLTAAATAVQAQTSTLMTVPAGWFMRGDSLDGGELSGEPTNMVYISAFAMDQNLVTFANWNTVLAWATNQGYTFASVGKGDGANNPVQSVDWFDAVAWCNARTAYSNSIAGFSLRACYYTDTNLSSVYLGGSGAVYMDPTATGFRLPTEAEWEKAARGLTQGQRFPFGNDISHTQTGIRAAYQSALNNPAYDLGPVSSGPTATVPVGSISQPNDFGLYDMAGNVQEWCWDWFSGSYYNNTTTNNPPGPAIGSKRVYRGGGWDLGAQYCRCANREDTTPTTKFPDLGFRCVQANVGQTVSQVAPVLAVPLSLGSLVYGQSLSVLEASLNSNMDNFIDATNNPMIGQLAFANPNLVPSVSSPNATVTFTPDASIYGTGYSVFTTNVPVTVNLATPELTLSATPIVLGQTLAASSLTNSVATNLNNNAFVPGTYAFTPNTNQPPLGANSESVTFTPEDLLDYNTVVSNVSVTVTSNSTPSSLTNLFVKVNPTASSIAFGQTLASSRLSGGVFTNSSGRAFTNAPGGFSGTLTFTNLGLTPVNVGSTNVWVIFTPTNPPNDFNSVTTTVPVAVAKAVPQLILGSGSLTNGQALSNATFSGSSAVNPNNGAAITALGTFAFVTPALVPNAGTTNVAVTFTPTGAAANDYTAVTNTTFSVTVAKDSPTLSVVIASGLKYGQALSASDLTNSKAINSFNKAAVAGTFAFTTPGSLPDAGTTPISVTFSPSNTANYLSGTTNANITVATTTPLLTALGTNYLLVGNSLTSLTPQESAINPYNANLKANGVFTFTTNWVPTKAATNTVGVTFTSASTNYNNATNTAVVVVLTSQTPVTVSNVVVTPKTYDGTTNATLSLANYALLGLASGDSSGVQLTNVGGGFFSDTNAGSGKLVTATLQLSGPKAAKYSLVPPLLTGTIYPRPLTLTANAATWDMSVLPANPPTFTFTCAGLIPSDVAGDTNALVGTNTVFGTSLGVWTPATTNLPDGTYANYIIPVLNGAAYDNYSITFGWGTLTITNSPNSGASISSLPPSSHAQIINGVVAPTSLAGFVGTNLVDQSGLNAVLAHYWSQTPPYITRPLISGQTNFYFTITNFTLAVQSSTDLTNWTNLNSQASVWFTDPNAVRGINLYYRLVGSTNSAN